MTKFIVGVVVGIFLGTSVGAYGAVTVGAGTSPSWNATKVGEEVRSDPLLASSTREIECD